MNDWPSNTNPKGPNRANRQRNRIAIQLEDNEKPAIDWLSRLPDGVDLPKPFQALKRCPARIIAKTLSGPQIRKLAAIHRRHHPTNGAQPPPC